ncbi:hypothetical protein F5888DRAFT_604604 [Russula emetica]|nr:hypothetical protein F5888DRAFT_604604 [Russula emetica]
MALVCGSPLTPLSSRMKLELVLKLTRRLTRLGHRRLCRRVRCCPSLRLWLTTNGPFMAREIPISKSVVVTPTSVDSSIIIGRPNNQLNAVFLIISITALSVGADQSHTPCAALHTWLADLAPRAVPTGAPFPLLYPLHSDKKQISVGFIGYPNVGKSSVINTLKSGKVCRAKRSI